MKLTHVLLACDLNQSYLMYWRIVRNCYRKMFNCQVKLLLVANEIPDDVDHKDDIILFTPVKDPTDKTGKTIIPTHFQAQCLRLLYPAVLETETNDDAIMINDIDLIPLDYKRIQYAIEACRDDMMLNAGCDIIKRIHDPQTNQFLKSKEMVLGFATATRKMWSDIFCIRGRAEVIQVLKTWYIDSKPQSDIIRWHSDQRFLYRYCNAKGLTKTVCFTHLMTEYVTNYRIIASVVKKRCPHTYYKKVITDLIKSTEEERKRKLFEILTGKYFMFILPRASPISKDNQDMESYGLIYNFHKFLNIHFNELQGKESYVNYA